MNCFFFLLFLVENDNNNDNKSIEQSLNKFGKKEKNWIDSGKCQKMTKRAASKHVTDRKGFARNKKERKKERKICKPFKKGQAERERESKKEI